MPPEQRSTNLKGPPSGQAPANVFPKGEEFVKKSMAIRIGGFAAALCASGALIGTAVSGTGAYFTDAHNGTIYANTGQIKVNVTPANGTLNFQNLLPGDYQTQQIDYTAQPVGGQNQTEDIWLVFPTDNGHGGNPSEAFTGVPEDPDPGALGRYGHFALSSTGGAHFTSYNLANPGTTSGHTGSSCSTNANGWGGSNAQPTSPSDTTTAGFCAPPDAILLQSNMANGQSGSATLTFGFTPLLTSQTQYANTTPIVNYKIVATQHGIAPNNQFNPKS